MAKPRRPVVQDLPSLDFDMPSLDFDTSLDFEPTDVDDDEAPAGDPVDATGEAIEKVRTAFEQRAANEKARFVQATDSEYWCCLCFETREQKEELLRALKLDDLGDKHLDGLEVAKRLGVTLKSPRPKWRAPTISSRLKALSEDD